MQGAARNSARVYAGRTGRRARPGSPVAAAMEGLEPRVLLSAVEAALSPPVDPLVAAQSAALSDASAAAAALDLNQTFYLHSQPGASKTIYLDFDGATTSGTYWNTYYNNGRDIVTPAYDFDGNAGAFSNAELERIQYIWQRVAEDYIPFDVDLTTQEPAAGGLVNSGGGDTTWGVRVVIGGGGAWLGQPAGGVAYMDSFTWNSDTPCFVFVDNLGNGA